MSLCIRHTVGVKRNAVFAAVILLPSLILRRACTTLLAIALPSKCPDPYSKFTVDRLKSELRAKGLPIYGRKAALVERLRGTDYLRQPPGREVAQQYRSIVFAAIQGGRWRMELRDWYVRPPRSLGRGWRNPLCDLGECGDQKCALYRFRPGCEPVRPGLTDFCAGKIMDHAQQNVGSDGLVYCSLGCGCLYFDWELLDRLIRVHHINVTQVWLVDRCFRPGNNESQASTRALDAFVAWFAKDGFETHAFPSARALKQWVSAFRPAEEDRAHVVMQCDAVDTFPILDEDHGFCDIVARDGALNLQFYSQLLGRRKPGPGRRRDPVPVAPVRRVRRKAMSCEDSGFQIEEAHTWRDGAWVPEELNWLADFGQEDCQEELRRQLEEEYR